MNAQNLNKPEEKQVAPSPSSIRPPSQSTPKRSSSACKRNVSLSVAFQKSVNSLRTKPITTDTVAKYMSKKFGIDLMQNLSSLNIVTRSGKEYGWAVDKSYQKRRNLHDAPTKEIPKNRANASTTQKITCKQPKKKLVLKNTLHTCSKSTEAPKDHAKKSDAFVKGTVIERLDEKNNSNMEDRKRIKRIKNN
ncbi:hypothetical protein TNCT_494911 [Trichonephila clavata]|uniref:Uncharacterized protein n=1 Tax=Trichonephila clavata TaxID=2740835 RepID=A0A8X6L874_TRICU|nr:hypothetical protein TNCT_494911 [Trichonephila clavata]